MTAGGDKIEPVRQTIGGAEEIDPRRIVRLAIDNGDNVTLEPGGSGGGDADLRPVEFSDIANAQRVSERFGSDWRYAAPSGPWYRWSAARWERDVTDGVVWIARDVLVEIGSRVEDLRLARRVESFTSINAALGIVKADPRHATPRDAFDANDWLLNTPAGTVDLRSCRMLQHRRDDLITRTTLVSPEGDCPTWYSFLRQATGGDVESINFLQCFIGYCLTGSTEEHAILLIHGPGGTGKSVALNTLSAMLGDYATMAPMDTFTVATGERHPADLALLEGARLVTASETEEGRRWDEAKLKAITGGDLITARRMRQDFFTFRPRFKLIVAGNYRPAMRSADDAMRRRFHVFPMTHKPAVIDRSLPEKLRAELPGILKWAIEGAAKWQQSGLRPSPVMVRATDEYFEAENSIGRWVQERAVKDAGKVTATGALYKDFKSWAVTVGEFVGSERRFAQRLQSMGFERARDGDAKRGFRGLGLRGVTGELALGGPVDGGDGLHDPAGDEPWRRDPADDWER